MGFKGIKKGSKKGLQEFKRGLKGKGSRRGLKGKGSKRGLKGV